MITDTEPDAERELHITRTVTMNTMRRETLSLTLPKMHGDPRYRRERI